MKHDLLKRSMIHARVRISITLNGGRERCARATLATSRNI